VTPAKTPKEIDDPAVDCKVGPHSKGEVAAAPVVAVVAVPAVVVLGAPPDTCADVADLVVHPVIGGSNAPAGVASVKVGTLRGSQPNESEDDTEAPAAPLVGCVEAEGFVVGEEAAVGEAKGPAPALRLLVWACAAPLARASHNTASHSIVARIGVRAIARSPVPSSVTGQSCASPSFPNAS
jgi:hypothetical protein